MSCELALTGLATSQLLFLSFPRLEGTPPQEQPVWLEVCTVLRAKRVRALHGLRILTLQSSRSYTVSPAHAPIDALPTLWLFH